MAVAQNGNRHFRARPGAGDDVAQVHAVFDLISIDDGDHVALLQARALGRAFPLDVADDHAANILESEIRGDVRSDSLNADAQIAAPDVAAFYQLFGDASSHVSRDREADADVAAGRRDDLRVDPHEFARRVDQRASGIALIDRRVGLQKALEAAVAQTRRASLRADDPGGHRLADAERIAHGQRHVAHPYAIGISQREHRQVVRVDLEHGQIAARIIAYDLRVVTSIVRQFGPDLLGPVDH